MNKRTVCENLKGVYADTIIWYFVSPFHVLQTLPLNYADQSYDILYLPFMFCKRSL